jgi:predicted amidohydrolase
MTYFTIAGLQLNLKDRQNFDIFRDKVRSTMRRFPFVQMIVGSELSICGAGVGYAGPMIEEVEDSLCELAAEFSIWLIPGSIYQREGDKVFKTAPVISPTGEVIKRFQKICPFLPFEKGVEAGSDICFFDVPEVGRFGLYICYDIWFPELSRAMVAEGVEVILHPTLTDTCDRDVEKAMARATAAQQQSYVVDINGTGALGVGQSMVVGPEGEVIHEALCGEEVILFEADLGRVRRSRERGILGLGQPLKSFRDGILTNAEKYAPNQSPYLDSLGPLEVAKRER